LQALAHNGIHHQRHGQHFPAGTEDAVWLPFVGEKGWILLTKDKRIRFNDLEKQAVIASRVREFYFTSGNFNGQEMAALLVVALPRMIRVYSRALPTTRFCQKP
jgi:PIN like domain